MPFYTARCTAYFLPQSGLLSPHGGLSPSLRAILRFDEKTTVEATLGYVQNSRQFHLGGGGSDAFETLRAYYGLLGITYSF